MSSMAKTFMFVCIGVLALGIAYHLTMSPAVAQATTGPRFAGISVYTDTENKSIVHAVAVTIDGDVYETVSHYAGTLSTWEYIGSVIDDLQSEGSE